MAEDQTNMAQHRAVSTRTLTGSTGSVGVITVEVFSDVICPWCYVGSRRLAEGIALFAADGGPAGGVSVEVLWHPFELNPDMPAAGRDRREYRSAKFGSWQRSQQLDAHVTEAGAEDGLVFRHDLVARTPNTRAAHRLIWLAQQHGQGQQMVDRLFAAYFTQGRDVGDPTVLADLAVKVGLSRDDASRTAAGDGVVGARAEAAVAAGLARGRALGISGVPFTVIAGAYALPPGAQPAEAIAQVLRLVRQDQQHEQAHGGPADASVPGGEALSCDLEGTCR